MKAAVCTRYGPPEVLLLQNVRDPVAGAKDVLIRIRATTVTPSDCYIRSMIPSASLAMRLIARAVIGFTRPRRPILGAILVGDIEKIGRKVSRFRVGDRVWAFTTLRMGCYAQRICSCGNRMKGPPPLPTIKGCSAMSLPGITLFVGYRPTMKETLDGRSLWIRWLD